MDKNWPESDTEADRNINMELSEMHEMMTVL